jgi:hypothetical protein
VSFFAHVWLAADLVCPSPATFVSVALDGPIILIRTDEFGDWLGQHEKSRMGLLGYVPLRSIETRSQDCAGSQGNSSACSSWQRGPWHHLHPGSVVRWEHIALGKAELYSHLYFELQCFISV